MAYKFQLGAYTASGSLTQEGAAEVDALTADSLNVQNGGISNAGAIAGATSIDGSGDLTMGTITMSGFAVDADGDVAMKSLKIDDDSHIGTDSDSDMILLDPGADITIANDLDFIIGKAGGLQLADGAVTSTAAELNLLDGSAAETIVNSKGVVYGSGGAVNATLYKLGGNQIISSAGDFQGNDASFSDITASSGLLVSGSGGASLITNGTVRFDANLDATISLANDALYFKDQNDNGNLKVDTVADIMALVAGNGLAASNGVLAVGVDDSSIELFSDAVRVKASGITNAMLAGSIQDSKLNTISTAGKVDLAALEIDGGTDIGADLADADLMVVDDGAGGTNRKAALSRIKKYIYSAISGDATASDAGALTIANDAVEQAMIADDAVGADQLASNAVVNASVASNAAIAFSKIDTNVDMGGNFTIGNQSDDIATFSGPVVVGGNLTVNGALTSINSTTIEITSSFTFEGPADDHETILSCATPSADTTLNLPTLSAGTYFLPALADAATDASAAVTAAEFALLDGGNSRGTDALADGDGFLHNDGGTMKQTNVLKIAEYAYSKVSGDATVSSAGALTIAANAVEGSMLNNNIVSGLDDIGADIANTDEMIISDAGTIKRMDMSRLKTFIGNGTAAVAQKDDGDTLAVGVNYFADHGGAESVTLPASAGMTVGESIRIKAGSDCSATNKLTISRAGSQTIDGVASIVLESPFAAVELVYVAADTWRVF